MTENRPSVIFELTAPYAGATVRLAGFDFQNGELHTSGSDADRIEDVLKRAAVPMQRKGSKTTKRKRR